MTHALPRRTTHLRVARLWIHLTCGLAAGFALLSQEQLSLNSIFFGGPRSKSVVPALYALPAIWPYIAGYVTSRQLPLGQVSHLALYGTVVVVGTVVGVWFMAHPISGMGTFGTVLLISILQAVAFAATTRALEAHTRDNGAA